MQGQFASSVKEIDYFGEKLTFRVGNIAPRAEASVWAQLGETVVFTIVSASSDDTSLDYFPLGVEYIEKFYAGGIISGSRFLKREMRPSDSAVIKARQVDHSIRSLFPKGFKKEVNVVVTVMSYDEVHDPVALAVTSASMALMLSSIPFHGPSASVQVAVKNGEFVVNPTTDKATSEKYEAEYMVSVREDRVLNIEGWGNELEESKMGELLDFAVTACKPLLDVQVEMQKEFGKQKVEFSESGVDKALVEFVEANHHDGVANALYNKENRDKLFGEVKKQVIEANPEATRNAVGEAVDYVARKIMRKDVLGSEKRTSGRRLDEVRELEIAGSILPRVHGSALFRRGTTQSLSIMTLGSTRLVQTLESFEGEAEKTFMHHYNAPNYSMGQAGRFSYYPGRREIGHGHIAENAMKCVLPSLDVFPYTIRVVSEILSQNGSSSMAATCATSLALMDGGVPIRTHIAGVACGLVTADDDMSNYKIMVDMEDVEDFYGDMDFKVTGSRKGVTAIQLDNKLRGVPVGVLKDAMAKSKIAREHILSEMEKVLSEPRKELNKYAPKAIVIKINPLKIGELIGPGGKVIKGILEKLGEGVDIDIQDNGNVNITAIESEKLEMAKKLVMEIVEEPVVGQIYNGVVDKIMPYGAFVNVTSNITGLLHVSEMSEKFVKDPNTVVKEGQKITVKIKSVENGKISFTVKGLQAA